MQLFELQQQERRRAESGRPYFEFLRVPRISAGIYTLEKGGVDLQRPHSEDEIYYVTAGRAMIRVNDQDRPVQPGTIVFVPAHAEHRFHSISEDLNLLVVFAPAEGSL